MGTYHGIILLFAEILWYEVINQENNLMHRLLYNENNR